MENNNATITPIGQPETVLKVGRVEIVKETYRINAKLDDNSLNKKIIHFNVRTNLPLGGIKWLTLKQVKQLYNKMTIKKLQRLCRFGKIDAERKNGKGPWLVNPTNLEKEIKNYI